MLGVGDVEYLERAHWVKERTDVEEVKAEIGRRRTRTGIWVDVASK